MVAVIRYEPVFTGGLCEDGWISQRLDYSLCRRPTVTHCIRRCVNMRISVCVGLCVCACVFLFRALHPVFLMRILTEFLFY